MYEKQLIGKCGENLVCKYFEKNNYKILERNFKCNQGEIDIIVFDNENRELVFCEVKTRTSFNYGFPSEAVNKIKQKHMINSSKYYLYRNGLNDVFVRFDVIEVVINKGKNMYKLNHLKNVL